MVHLVEQLQSVIKRLQHSLTDSERDYLKRRVEDLDFQVERAVVDMYGLSNSDFEVVLASLT